MTKNIRRASKVIDFQLERLRVALGVQIWVYAGFGTGFGIQKNIQRASKVINFQLERLRVTLGVQIWVYAGFGAGFGVMN